MTDAPEDDETTPEEEIEQEEQARRSVALPLLALLVLGLVGFLLMRGCADSPTGPDGSTPSTETSAAPDTSTLTTLDAFAVADLRGLVGRRVRLNSVQADRVIGDSSFLVRGTTGQPLLAVLQGLGEAQHGADDGRYTVDAGEALDLIGTVAAYPPADTVALSEEDRAAARRQGIYLRVRRVLPPSP